MSYKSLDQAVSRIEELEKKLDTLRRNLIDSSILVDILRGTLQGSLKEFPVAFSSRDKLYSHIDVPKSLDVYDAQVLSVKFRDVIWSPSREENIQDLAEAALRLVDIPGDMTVTYTCLLHVAGKLQSRGAESSLATGPFFFNRSLSYRIDEALLKAAVWLWVDSRGTYTFEGAIAFLSYSSNGRPMRRAMHFMDECTRPVQLQQVYTRIAQEFASNKETRLSTEIALMIRDHIWKASTAYKQLPFLETVHQAWASGSASDCGRPSTCFTERRCPYHSPSSRARFWLAKQRKYCFRPASFN